jgi:predicted nucleotidyltransferase
MIKKSIKQQIKEYFFLCPTAKLRVRQIERVVRVPLPSAIRYTKELENEGILKSETIADVHLYSADRTLEAFFLEKKLFNIRQLYAVGLIEFLIEELHNPGIVVFGSYGRGEDVEGSDIDLYIETAAKKIIDLKKFEKKLQRNVQLFRHKCLRDIKNKDLANNIMNGMTLHGFVEVFK